MPLTRDEQLSLFPPEPRDWWAALRTVEDAVHEYRPSHVFALFSGGHDSVCSTYVAARHPAFSGAVHLNTGTGIAATHSYVVETCARYGWPLIEYEPAGVRYEHLVRERGFPGGPKAHNAMYYWLKQRSVRRLIREHKRSRHDRILLVTGIRTSESVRRMGAGLSVPIRRDGSQVWVNPILDWTGLDTTRFMAAEGIPRNPVVQLLHRSGECLCGALAQPRELAEIEAWFPEDVRPIRELERECAARGLPAVWGMRTQKRPAPSEMRLPLCWTCDNRLVADEWDDD